MGFSHPPKVGFLHSARESRPSDAKGKPSAVSGDDHHHAIGLGWRYKGRVKD